MTDYREKLYSRYLAHQPTTEVSVSLDSFRPRAPYLRKVISNHFPGDRQARIVDLGCGHGALVHFARQEGYTDVSGVDRSPDQVAAAVSLGIDGIRQGDLLNELQSLPADSIDALLSFDVIEHLTKEEVMEFAAQARRVIKPGGRWILHTCNGDSPFAGRVLYGDFTHELAYTQRSMTQLLLATGFSQIRCHEERPIAHGIFSLSRLALWRILRLGLAFFIAVETGDWKSKKILSQNFLVVATK